MEITCTCISIAIRIINGALNLFLFINYSSGSKRGGGVGGGGLAGAAVDRQTHIVCDINNNIPLPSIRGRW